MSFWYLLICKVLMHKKFKFGSIFVFSTITLRLESLFKFLFFQKRLKFTQIEEFRRFGTYPVQISGGRKFLVVRGVRISFSLTFLLYVSRFFHHSTEPIQKSFSRNTFWKCSMVPWDSSARKRFLTVLLCTLKRWLAVVEVSKLRSCVLVALRRTQTFATKRLRWWSISQAVALL